jgi:hypothetical protein
MTRPTVETIISSLTSDGAIFYSRVEDDGARVVVALDVVYRNANPDYDDETQAKADKIMQAMKAGGYHFLDAGAEEDRQAEYWIFKLEQVDDEPAALAADQFRCDDGTGAVVLTAGSAREAAQSYVDDCDYDQRDGTYWVAVQVESADGDVATIKVAIDPEEPACVGGHVHRWRDSGVRGHGGGVVQTDECRWCGLQRHADTWAQDTTDGEQGLTGVSYEEPSASFRPLPFERYPALRSLIEEGDRLLVDGAVLTVHASEEEACGWVVRNAQGVEVGHLAELVERDGWEAVTVEAA